MSNRDAFYDKLDALWYDGITATSHHQQLEAHRALRRLVAEELAKGTPSDEHLAAGEIARQALERKLGVPVRIDDSVPDGVVLIETSKGRIAFQLPDKVGSGEKNGTV